MWKLERVLGSIASMQESMKLINTHAHLSATQQKRKFASHQVLTSLQHIDSLSSCLVIGVCQEGEFRYPWVARWITADLDTKRVVNCLPRSCLADIETSRSTVVLRSSTICSGQNKKNHHQAQTNTTISDDHSSQVQATYSNITLQYSAKKIRKKLQR